MFCGDPLSHSFSCSGGAFWGPLLCGALSALCTTMLPQQLLGLGEKGDRGSVSLWDKYSCHCITNHVYRNRGYTLSISCQSPH